ncbi:hypothetical protein ACIBUY_11325 [Streptomyces sp. NPDC050085]|uniref:hypothetical protein n=1 Tax=Streptomyces sp. NPDC050085 TaxID=3365600 RepID=UPI0037927DA5
MTQPPGQPPQDGQGQGQGYGYGGPQQPPVPGPYGSPQSPGPYGAPPPPGPYGSDNPYASAPTTPMPAYGQPPQQPQPYGQFPPPQGPFPPAPPEQGGGRKRAVLIAVAVVVVAALAGGGVLLATSGDDGGDDKPVAGQSSVVATGSAGPGPSSEAPSPEVSGPEVSGPASEDPYADEPTDEPTDGPSERPAGDTGYQGQWQNEKAQTLTIAGKIASGSAKGKYNVSYIDAGGKGICSGIGQPQGASGFRIAVSCMGQDTGKQVFAANLTQASDVVTLTWDKGGSVKLPWVGAGAS